MEKFFIKCMLPCLLLFITSCENDLQEVQDFLAEKNLPIGVAENVYLIHTDSGRVKTTLTTAMLKDFSNRENHPYQEFPRGIKLVTFDEFGDSITLTANQAITYTKTGISIVNGNVIVQNHKERSTLFTEQLFWDQNTHYMFTEKKFRLIRENGPHKDTINGIGFESNEDLSKATFKEIDGPIYINESNNKP
ncbi:LPS export ABC transporter periplasmic protein LptC [Flavobacteriaceae bacterium F08102]|nr:LPS export ABC transporter periplasmic protein LptC [Flavobacteriaceae bacterium F08102]